MPPKPSTRADFVVRSLGSITVTGPLDAVGDLLAPAFQAAWAWFTSATPLLFEFTFSTTVSIVNVIVSSVELSVSVLTMSPRDQVAVVA